MKRSWIKRGTKGFKPRVKGLSRKTQKLLNWQSSPATKDRIQALLRKIVIKRDGGCLLRNSSETGSCGSRPTKSGELILQAEHLHTRANSASYADSRLVICLCERHHIYYKPQHSDEYYRIVRELIGPFRSTLLTRVQEDRSAHRFYQSDWLILEAELQKELDKLPTVDNFLGENKAVGVE